MGRPGPQAPQPVVSDIDLPLPRSARFSWADENAVRTWIGIGMTGLTDDGHELDTWRGTNDARDTAFAYGLYGTGLRLSEWAALLVDELPPDEPGRTYYKRWLPPGCAKGRRHHDYWMPRWVLTEALTYCETGRAAAVRRAQQAGRYERQHAILTVLSAHPDGTVQTVDAHGVLRRVDLHNAGFDLRRRLYRVTPDGPEPLALWLNADGLPRNLKGWHKTWVAANARVAAAGYPKLRLTPHMLRHSFALRWYATGYMLHRRAYAGLTDDELRDFRSQYGDVWQLVQTMLGHYSLETTTSTYLEPFRSLAVDLLLQHAADDPVRGLMDTLLAEHPQVINGPSTA